MGVIFLVISLFAGIAKGYCGKKTSNSINGFNNAVSVSIIRISICIIIGFIISIANEKNSLLPNVIMLAVSAVSGISTAFFLMFWLISVKKGAYMLLDVFLMLGVIVPLLFGIAVFGEIVTIKQWFGIFILVLASIIMCSYNNSIKNKLDFKAIVVLVLCAFANGVTDFSQKLFVKMSPTAPISVFNFYTYLFSFVTLMIIQCILRRESEEKNPLNYKKIFGYILFMSVCLFLNNYFKTKSAVFLNSAQLYPMYQAGSLTLSAIMSNVFFKEKLTPKCIMGIILSFFGVVTINF